MNWRQKNIKGSYPAVGNMNIANRYLKKKTLCQDFFENQYHIVKKKIIFFLRIEVGINKNK